MHLRSCAPLVALLLLAPAVAAQQPGQGPPQRAENLKVLPKDTPRDTVIQIMRGFAMSLGVRCTYCHVSTESEGREQFDFARDDKPTKEKARAMMRMTASINRELLPKVPDRRTPPVGVNCMTCHRTMAVPTTLAQVLDSSLAAGGRDSAMALYRRLKDSEATRGRWDFSELTLSEWARDLATRNSVTDAIAVLELNAEQYPNSPAIDMQLGDLYRRAGDKEKAIARYRMALTKQPNNRQARARITELGGTP